MTNHVPPHHPRAVQDRLGEDLFEGTVEISAQVEAMFRETMALGLTSVGVETAAQIVLAAQMKRIADVLEGCQSPCGALETVTLINN